MEGDRSPSPTFLPTPSLPVPRALVRRCEYLFVSGTPATSAGGRQDLRAPALLGARRRRLGGIRYRSSMVVSPRAKAGVN